MYGIIRQKMARGTLGGSSASVLLSGVGFNHVRSYGKYFLLGASAYLKPRDKALLSMSSGKSLADNEELFRLKSCLEIGNTKDVPPPAIELTSSEGERMSMDSLQEGNSKGFIPLMFSYRGVSEPGFYGVASISAVLNTLEAASDKKWKRPWRWCYEFFLDSCDSFEKIQAEGLTFGKLAFLAHCNGAKVEAFQTNQCTIDDFRKHIMKCASFEDFFMVTFFNRALLNQMGAGHISPIGGYHAGRDMVLVMDVARFESFPFWIPLTLFWKAMDTINPTTGHHNGFLVLSRLSYDPSVLYTLSCSDESWTSTAYYLSRVHLLLKSEDLKDIQRVLSVLFTSHTTNFREFIKQVTIVNKPEDSKSDLRRNKKRLAIQEELLKHVQQTELYTYVTRWLDSGRSITSFGNKYTFPEIGANICCHGVEHSPRNQGSPSKFYCTDANEPSKVMSSPVVAHTTEQGADIMVQSTHIGPNGTGSSNDIEISLPSADVLTVLLLALPPHTWSGIKDSKLLAKINDVVSIEKTPTLLKNEVLSLRQQLHLLMIDVGSPSS